MRISPILLARLLLYSFLFGVFLAILNGAARSATALIDGKSLFKSSALERWLSGLYPARREEKRQPKIIRCVRYAYTFVVDLAIFILMGAGIILLCYYLNSGEFRGFCVLGVGLGFLLCRLTIGRMIALVFGELMILVRGIAFWSFKIILLPLTIFLKKCKKLLKILAIKISNALEKKEKVLYNDNELLYIYTLSEKGFGFLRENNSSITEQEQKNGTDKES